MREGVLYSAGLHAVILAVAIFGLPRLFERPPPLPQAIEVALVTPDILGEPPEPEPEPKPAPAANNEPPPPPPAQETPPPAPPEPVVEKAPAPKPPEPESAPAPPKPEAKPAPPKPEPEPAAKAERAPPKAEPPKAEPPKPPPQVAMRSPPAPRRKPKPKPAEDELQSLLKNLAKERAVHAAKTSEPTEKPQRTVAPKPPPDPIAAALGAGRRESPQPRASIDERRVVAELVQMIRQQVTPCWSIPVGVKDAEKISVEVNIRLNPDGSLRGAPRIVDRRRMQAEANFRAVAESALRALRNPRCMPLRLPTERFALWQEISFNFDSREAIGQ